MAIKVNFKYIEEVISFYNKTLRIGAGIFFVFLFLVGYFCSDFKTTMGVLGVVALVYLVIGIKTLSIAKKKREFKKNGIKCQGIIKDMKVVERHRGLTNSFDNRYETVYLIVEYRNPNTNAVEEFVTEAVNGSPFAYLSSLDVTVYALEDGRAYATDFKKVKKLKDAVKYQDWYIEKKKSESNEHTAVYKTVNETDTRVEYNETHIIDLKDKDVTQIKEEVSGALSESWDNTKKTVFTKDKYKKFKKKALLIYTLVCLPVAVIFFAINIFLGLFVSIILIVSAVVFFAVLKAICK